MQLIASEPSTAGVDGLFVAKAIEVRQGFVRGTVAAWSNDQTDFGPGREVERRRADLPWAFGAIGEQALTSVCLVGVAAVASMMWLVTAFGRSWSPLAWRLCWRRC